MATQVDHIKLKTVKTISKQPLMLVIIISKQPSNNILWYKLFTCSLN